LQEDKLNKTNSSNIYYDFDEESLRFLNFISEIKDKTYTGKWSSKSNILELNDTGIIKLRIVDEEINKLSKLTINKFNYRLVLIIQEGNSLDKFISSLVSLSYKTNFQYDAGLNIIKSKDTKGMSGYYSYFKNQWVKSMFKLNLAIDFAFVIELSKDKFNQTQKKIQGKFSLNNNELDFEAEQETSEYINSIHNKVNNFSVILTIIGTIHLLHSTFILKKLNLEPNYSRKVLEKFKKVIPDCIQSRCFVE
jgi:hypothetical protein